MSLSTSHFERFLTEMEYPATKDDLVREASREGLDPTDITALRALPDGGYDARCRVRDALTAISHADGLIVA